MHLKTLIQQSCAVKSYLLGAMLCGVGLNLPVANSLIEHVSSCGPCCSQPNVYIRIETRSRPPCSKSRFEHATSFRDGGIEIDGSPKFVRGRVPENVPGQTWKTWHCSAFDFRVRKDHMATNRPYSLWCGLPVSSSFRMVEISDEALMWHIQGIMFSCLKKTMTHLISLGHCPGSKPDCHRYVSYGSGRNYQKEKHQPVIFIQWLQTTFCPDGTYREHSQSHEMTQPSPFNTLALNTKIKPRRRTQRRLMLNARHHLGWLST
jgi:hypothetical protein